MGMSKVKTCAKCGVTKALEDFHKRTASKDGHHPHCKVCAGRDERQRRQHDRVRITQQRHEHYESNRERLLEATGQWREQNRELANALSREAVAKLQAQTLETATNHYKHWTGPEMELLLRDDLSSKDLARMLGRTYRATAHMRRAVQHDPRKQVLAGVDRAEF